jgi:solute carrier family 66 (lysosomal lysine-arginine transporter), member 1
LHSFKLIYINSSISIACWVVVFSPQIIENFRRGSADGLSILFLVVWLAGDVFNILGAVLQGVLPTMIILALYYTLADIVLLGQCFYYRGFTLSDAPTKSQNDESSEESTLLGGSSSGTGGNGYGSRPTERTQRRESQVSFRERLTSVDGTHLSPATPLLDVPRASDPPAVENIRPTSTLQTIIFNTFAIILVCAAGAFGWWVSERRSHRGEPKEEEASNLYFDLWGQIFGYLCALLYLGSRFPQLLLNWRRKSTEGVSLLFFLFACIGNLTYVLSIFAYSPICRVPGQCLPGEATSIYGRYILVNLSWLLGSFGTLLLDMGIFVQFFLYRVADEDYSDEDESEIFSETIGGA